MVKVTIVQVIYNSKRFIQPVFSAIFNQTFKDYEVVAVISGNEDRGKELLMEKFPRVNIIDPGFNIGFAAGHNLVFATSNSEFFQLVNPDMIMEPNYVEEMLKAFDDPKVGAATGKLYQVTSDLFDRLKAGKLSAKGGSAYGGQVTSQQFDSEKSNFKILDTTGVAIAKSGRARDRGQHEVDIGQYDKDISIQAVSGAGCMYRRAALEKVKTPTTPSSFAGHPSLTGEEAPRLSSGALRSSPPDKGEYPAKRGEGVGVYEYFDEDFHSYWEDVDLSWRMANAGWKNVFVPSAIGYHGRGAGSSEKGYSDVLGFIKHHKKLNSRVRRLNYQNHIFMYIKNSPYFYPQFFAREFFMLGYILLFEISTLKVLPEMLKLLPKIVGKRKFIRRNLLKLGN